MTFPHPRRAELIDFLKGLREEIITAFQALESAHQFTRKSWNYQQQGGGEMGVIRGTHFEKAAVNWSGVGGETFPMSDSQGPFFATGISLITHMSNPHAPTVHMNIRFIETAEKFWFGGGYDLTPMGFPYDEDRVHFHKIAREAVGDALYDTFSKNAAEYFYIPHRKKERGMGGLFFDHYNTGDFEVDLAMWKRVGQTFLQSILPIYEKRMHQPFIDQDKELQLYARAHYAEFNLLYDRGTKFGFQSGGNPEAILCSMPPLVRW